jgi:hypothetical protein
VSLRQHLETVERTTGIHDPELDEPEIPEGFESWFIRFMELRKGESVSYADLDAYQRITGCRLSSVEVQAIFAMDRAASSAIAEIMKETSGG